MDGEESVYSIDCMSVPSATSSPARSVILQPQLAKMVLKPQTSSCAMDTSHTLLIGANKTLLSSRCQFVDRSVRVMVPMLIAKTMESPTSEILWGAMMRSVLKSFWMQEMWAVVLESRKIAGSGV